MEAEQTSRRNDRFFWHQALDRATFSQPIIAMPRALKPHSGDT
jgi:hypothetical protein